MKHDLGPVHVGLDGTDGRLDDKLDTDRRRQMKHHVGVVDVLGEHWLVRDRVDCVGEARPRLEVLDVRDRARR